MFQSLFYDHLQGSSFVLSAFTTFRLPASSFVFLVCRLCVCVSGLPVCGLSGRELYQNFIIQYLYEAQHVSGYTPPIIKNLKMHWQPLFFSYVEGCWTCNWWTVSVTVFVTPLLLPAAIFLPFLVRHSIRHTVTATCCYSGG
jgi:hypothetical protein